MTQRCPISHHDYRLAGPVHSHYAHLDQEREGAPLWWNDGAERPFWMVTRYAEVHEALQQPDLFSNEISNVLSPRRPVRLQPNNLDAPEHARLRRVLNRWFSPAAVRHIEPDVIRRAQELVEEMAPRGEADLVSDFALRYATDLFLASLGLPLEDGAQFLEWVETLFVNLYTGPVAEAAMAAITDYFGVAIAARLTRPRDPDKDFLTRMLRPDVMGDWLSHDDLLVVCLSLMAAGLDTTRSALGYVFHHLATHPDDRARLIAEPSLVPRAVEEMIRLYSLIIQDGRVVTRDVEFHGAAMKAGDLVWLGIASANRDPRKFEQPETFDLDRSELSHHLGFGAGPHRCLGMHLARHELAIALREWHRRIPDYALAPGVEVTERGAQLSLYSLPLRWSVEPRLERR